jgi:hypothetical protein
VERAPRPFVIVYLAENQSSQELAREPSRRAGLQRMAVELQRLRARRAKGTIRLVEIDHQRRVPGPVIRDERV